MFTTSAFGEASNNSAPTCVVVIRRPPRAAWGRTPRAYHHYGEWHGLRISAAREVRTRMDESRDH